MKKRITQFLSGVLTAVMLMGSAFAAEVTPSTSSISLTSGQTSCTFDVSLKTDSAFAGAEFGLKPSAADVTISMSWMDDVKNESHVSTVKDGVLYFGFFAGSNKFEAGTYRVARITCTYTGTGSRTVTLDSSKVVTIDAESGMTVGDTSARAFTVTINRSSTSGDGGDGGGGNVTPVKPSQPSGEGTKHFIDVPSNAYYHDAVEWAVKNGVTTGTSATTFSPNMSCTRAQMVTFLWRDAGSPAPKSKIMPFTDVSSGAYYYDAVLWAIENGITVGTSPATFSPNAVVTRGQTVTFLHRAAGSPTVSTSGSFTDVSADAYYAGAVEWAVNRGVTNGTGDKQFSPYANCTRAQIVTFMYRNAQSFS